MEDKSSQNKWIQYNLNANSANNCDSNYEDVLKKKKRIPFKGVMKKPYILVNCFNISNFPPYHLVDMLNN